MTTTSASSSHSGLQRAQTDSGTMFIVYRQPIALDRFAVYDVLPQDSAAAASSVVSTSSKSPHPTRSAREPQRNAGLTAEHGDNQCLILPRLVMFTLCNRPVILVMYSFLADRTNCRAYATVLRPSVCLSVCRL